MKSFVLHIYPRDISEDSSDEKPAIVGTVENIEDDKQMPFTSVQELWEILSAQQNDSIANH